MTRIFQRQIAERIQEILSTVILREVRDPRVQGITILEVRVDRELDFADIYVHSFADDDRADEVMAGLNSANKFLRHRVSQVLRTRNVPKLHFHWDPTAVTSDRIHNILDNLTYMDEEE